MSRITIRTSIERGNDCSEWDRFVDRSPEASGYHLWNWRHVFERAFGHATEYLMADAGGRIAGILPLVVFESWIFGRFAVSLPFVNYGGVVAEDPAVARQLIDAALELGRRRRLRHVELRHRSQHFADLPAKRHKVAMLLPLPADEQVLWEGLDRKVRNQVRKAQKSGLSAHEGQVELLEEFYQVFAENMRDLGTPVFSRSFFREVLQQFPDRTKVFLVRQGERPIAASITYGHRDVNEVPWASSLRAYRTSAPNMLLYWTMLQHAARAGFRCFDFGRSTPDQGTFHFKRQWGAVPEPLVWEYGLLGSAAVPDMSPGNDRFAAAIRAWQRIPVWMTRMMGPAIVRNIPA
jgi:FemAB-related protein (PEP-CTERM system-associated)